MCRMSLIKKLRQSVTSNYFLKFKGETSQTMEYHKLFEGNDHSSNYTKFRPKTPEQIIKWILVYLREKVANDNADGRFVTAADIGCGTGQCTILLARYFQTVYGFDVSESQIKQANNDNQYNNVTYVVSSAEKIPLPDNSVDLITCAQCFHWFDFEKFYSEVRRVLKANGVIALITYIRPLIVHSDEELRNLIRNALINSPLNKYVDEKVKFVDNGYADVHLPFNDEKRKRMTIYNDNISGSQIIGYIKSWSSFGQCLKFDLESAKQMECDIQNLIRAKTGKDIEEEQFTLQTPFYLLLARN